MGGAFKYARNKEGVTLVELILSIALVLIAAVLMFTFFSFMNRSNRLARQQSEIQENVVLAVIARSMPQVNVFIVSLPLKIFVGLTVLAVSLCYLSPLIARVFESIFRFWHRLLT